MAPYLKSPKSFDGVNINTSPYRTYFERGVEATLGGGPLVEDVAVRPIGSAERFVRSQIIGRPWPLSIELLDLSETNLSAMLKLFDARKGLRTLVLTDGDGVDRRISVRCRGIAEGPTPATWVANLYAFDPLMYSDALVTTPVTIDASPKAFSLTNNGNTRTRNMTIDVTAPTAKESAYYKFLKRRQVVLVNRSTKDLIGHIVGIPDAGFDTAAIVKVAATSTTLNGALGAGATTITVASTTGFDASGMAYITDGTNGDEQFSYTSKNATQFLGVTRGIGGTSDVAHANGLAVNKSNMLKNGNDLRVYVDGAEVKRAFPTSGSGRVNDTATKAFIAIDVPAEQTTLKLKAAITAGAPANGGQIDLTEDSSTAGYPDVGAFVIDNECFEYNGREARAFLNIVRGARGTTAASHSANAQLRRVHHDIQIAWGWAGADTPTALTTATTVNNISNTQWQWTNFGGTSGLILPLAWSRLLADTDKDPLARFTQLNQASTQMLWQDAAPSAGKPPINSLLQTWGPPSDNVAAAITLDVLKNPALSIVIYGLDADGNEVELETYDGDSGGSYVTGQTIDSPGVLYGVRIAALHRAIAGAEASGGSDVPVTSSSPKMMTFTVDADLAEVDSFAFKIKEGGVAPTENLSIDLYELVEQADGSFAADTTVKLIPTQTVTPADTTASFATISKVLATKVKLPGGGRKYGFAFTTADVNGYLLQASDGSVYAGGEARSGGQFVAQISVDYNSNAKGDGTFPSTATVLTPNEVSGTTSDIHCQLRFPLATLPASLNIQSAVLRINVTSAGQGIWIRNYAPNTAGQYGTTDPSGDSAATQFAQSGTHTYAIPSQAVNSTGVKDIALSGDITTDIENAKAIADRISFKVQTHLDDHFEFESLAAAGTAEPKLIVTYTENDEAAFATKLGQDIWFRVYGSPVSADAPSETDGQVGVDNVIVKFASGTAPLILTGAEEAAYFLSGLLENLTTGQDLAFAGVFPMGKTLHIDCATGICSISETGELVSWLVTPTDAAGFLGLDPGSNSLQYTEAGAPTAATDPTLTFKHRHAWQ